MGYEYVMLEPGAYSVNDTDGNHVELANGCIREWPSVAAVLADYPNAVDCTDRYTEIF